MLRHRLAVLSLLAGVAVVGLAACGDSGDSTDRESSGRMATTAAERSGTRSGERSATTMARKTDSGPVGDASGGGLFRDPQGTYTMVIGRGWRAIREGIPDGVEAWVIGDAENGFAPNVNVLTQASGDASLDDYLGMSEAQGRSLLQDYETKATDVVRGPSGEALGVFEYTATQGRPLHFLAVIALHGGRAVVATLTAPGSSFGSYRSAAEPFMRTLDTTP